MFQGLVFDGFINSPLFSPGYTIVENRPQTRFEKDTVGLCHTSSEDFNIDLDRRGLGVFVPLVPVISASREQGEGSRSSEFFGGF